MHYILLSTAWRGLVISFSAKSKNLISEAQIETKAGEEVKTESCNS